MPPVLADGSAGTDPLAGGLVPPPAVLENLKRVQSHQTFPSLQKIKTPEMSNK